MRTTHIIFLLASVSLARCWAIGDRWRPRPRTEPQQVLAADRRPSVSPLWPGSSSTSRAHDDDRPRAGFVALGDSYSAGIGTGLDGPENDCRQGLHAHPELIARDLAMHNGAEFNHSDFQFLSCTGSTTAQILAGNPESQMDAVNSSLPIDFALLSVGGNDLAFFEVMNACIFRFYNFYSGTCEAALDHSQELLESDEFEQSLHVIILELLSKARWEKKPWFLITVTGYARFFNDQTDECDEMSLGVWWGGPKLKKDLRVRMNEMVQAVNGKIAETVARINALYANVKVLFVDYDAEFEGHRFCEPRVVEPDYARNETWFFLVGGEDNARNGTPAAAGRRSQTISPTSDLVNTKYCLEPAMKSGDWGLLALCYMALSRSGDPNLRMAGEIDAENSMWYVPTYYGKTFHPRTQGQEAIRDKIYEKWAEVDSPAEIDSSCDSEDI